MIGNNSASVVAEAYVKGLRGYDIDTLWQAVKHGANHEGPISAVGRAGVDFYNDLGYVPYDVGINENAARTLEYAYDDFAIYQLGKALGKPPTEIALPVAVQPFQMGRRFHGREQLALHVVGVPGRAGTGGPDGRARTLCRQARSGVHPVAGVRRKLLQGGDPRNPRNADRQHGPVRARQPADPAHDLFIRLRRRAVENPVLGARDHEPPVPAHARRLLRGRGQRPDVGLVRVFGAGLLSGHAGRAAVRGGRAAVQKSHASAGKRQVGRHQCVGQRRGPAVRDVARNERQALHPQLARSRSAAARRHARFRHVGTTRHPARHGARRRPLLAVHRPALLTLAARRRRRTIATSPAGLTKPSHHDYFLPHQGSAPSRCAPQAQYPGHAGQRSVRPHHAHGRAPVRLADCRRVAHRQRPPVVQVARGRGSRVDPAHARAVRQRGRQRRTADHSRHAGRRLLPRQPAGRQRHPLLRGRAAGDRGRPLPGRHVRAGHRAAPDHAGRTDDPVGLGQYGHGADRDDARAGPHRSDQRPAQPQPVHRRFPGHAARQRARHAAHGSADQPGDARPAGARRARHESALPGRTGDRRRRLDPRRNRRRPQGVPRGVEPVRHAVRARHRGRSLYAAARSEARTGHRHHQDAFCRHAGHRRGAVRHRQRRRPERAAPRAKRRPRRHRCGRQRGDLFGRRRPGVPPPLRSAQRLRRRPGQPGSTAPGVPAAHRPGQRRMRGRRGAAALEPPDAGRHRPGRIHAHHRAFAPGAGSDHLGARYGARPAAGVAPGRPHAAAVAQRLCGQPAGSGLCGPRGRWPARAPPAAPLPGTGNHRERHHGAAGQGPRHAGIAGARRHPPGHRRFRHRLQQPGVFAAHAGRRGQDRPVVRARAGKRPAPARAGAGHDFAVAGPGPPRGGRRRGKWRGAGVPARGRLRRGAGLPVRAADGGDGFRALAPRQQRQRGEQGTRYRQRAGGRGTRLCHARPAPAVHHAGAAHDRGGATPAAGDAAGAHHGRFARVVVAHLLAVGEHAVHIDLAGPVGRQVERHHHLVAYAVLVVGALEDVRPGLQLLVHPCADGHVGAPELAQPAPVFVHVGHLVAVALGVLRQLVPVHERAQFGVAGRIGDIELARGFVAVVDLRGAGRQQQLGGAFERALARGVERRIEVVRIEVVQDRVAFQPAVQHGRIAREQRLVILVRIAHQAEVDQAVEAVLVVVGRDAAAKVEVLAVGDVVVVDFGRHVKLVAEFLVRIGALPVVVSRIGHGAQLFPHLRFHVLDGVGAEAVHAELADPVGVPLHQVVARRARVAGLGKELVELLDLLRVAPFAAPFFHQLRRQFHFRVAVGADVGQVFYQRARDGGRRVLVRAFRFGAHPFLRPHGVDIGDRTRMVHHHVEDHANAVRMRGVHHVAEVGFGAQVGVHGRKIPGPVAMETVGLAGAFVGGRVDLLHRRREPDGSHAQLVKITVVDLVDDAGQVAAHEAAQRRRVLLAAVGQVVARKGVAEAVGQHEIHGGVFPQKRLDCLRHLDRRRAFFLDAGGLRCGVVCCGCALDCAKRQCHRQCQGSAGPPCECHAVVLLVLRGDGRTRASGPSFDARHLFGDQYQRGERLLGGQVMQCGVGLVAFQVHAQGGAFGAGARQAEHHARTVGHHDADALLFRDRTVDRIGVLEIVGEIDDVRAQVRATQGGKLDAQGIHELIGALGFHRLVIVTRIVVAAEARPVFADQFFHRLAGGSEQVKPEQHGPQAVFFADVIGAGAVALFAAQRGLAGVEQVAEELPAGRRFETRDAQRLGHAVGRLRRRHRAGDAFQARAVARRHGGVGGQHGQAVRWRDVELAAHDHVAVAVAVRRSAEIGRVVGRHDLDQLGSVDGIRVRVQAAEILQRLAIDHGAGRRAEDAFQDGLGVRAGHGRHAVKAHAEAAVEQRTDGVEVEQFLHQFRVVGHRVDDHDLGLFDARGAQLVQVHGRRIADAVRGDRFGAREDRFGDRLRSRAAVGDVVLDAEVAVRAARIVAGRQHDAARRAMLADHAAHGRGGQHAALPHQHPGVAMGGRHAQDDLDRFAVMVAAVAADDQRLAGHVAQRVEHALHEILEVAGLLEDGNLLAQAGRAGPLARKYLGGDRLNTHVRSAWMNDSLLTFGGRVILNGQRQHRRHQHAHAAQHQGFYGLAHEQVLGHKAEQQAADNLRNHDKEIEHAHVITHAVGGQRAGQDRIRHGQDAGPGDAHADHRHAQRVGELAAGVARQHRQHERGQRGHAAVHGKHHAHVAARRLERGRLRIGGAKDIFADRDVGIDPHRKQADPGEELHRRQLHHGLGHADKAGQDFLERMQQALVAALLGAKRLHVGGRQFLGGQHGPQHGAQVDRAACVERVAHGIGNGAGHRLVGHAQVVGKNGRQQRGDHRAPADEESLHGEAGRLLRRTQLVADKRAERLHRDIDRAIEHPQHRHGHPQRRRIGHQEQGQRREHGAQEEERPAAAPGGVPGVIAQVADHRLHQQAGNGRGQPVQRQIVGIGAQGGENAAGVGVLQGKTELDAKEAKAHVPQLPERQYGLLEV
uniref:Glycosyl hydrolase family 92 domain-containing protein n=1 Tax=Tanacetum cinerariifolium TaxID=118510 RepID=A0A699GG71_TANCI|nr:hypothetical protein [Tanacetum cinerariifolium]